jgi:hypothetical protein
MPKLTTIDNTSVSPLRTQAPQVRVSVTPEQIAGPEVRLLTELGKKADEVTAFVVKRQNTKDLEIVTRADTAMKEVLLEQRLAAEKRRGIDASGLLTEQHELFDSNMQPKDGQVVTPAHQRYLDVYQSADPRQQRAMDLQKNKQRLVHLKAMGSYEEAQTSDAAVKAHKANVEISVAKGIAATTQEELDLELSSIYSQFDSIKSLTGAEASTVQAEQMKEISAIHTGRLEHLINAKDIVGAEKYFEKYKADMLDTSKMEKELATSKEDILAEVAADEATQMRVVEHKPKEAVALLDKLPPGMQAKAYAQYNNDITQGETIRKQRIINTQEAMQASVYAKKDGKWAFNKYSDLPLKVRSAIEENEGFKDKWRKEMSQRNDPIEPSKASQAKAVNLLTALQFGTRAEQMQFATYNLTGLGLDNDNHAAFTKAQKEILNPTPGSKGKTNYLASAIKRSNFDTTNDGDMEVQGQLVMEVLQSVAAGEGKTDTKAAGELPFDEYKAIVDKFFNPGKVSTMKKANSRPKPSTDKGKTFGGTPAAIAKRYLEIRGTESDNLETSDRYEAAWEDSVSKYASKYFQATGKYAPDAAIERFMQFAEKNVVEYEGDEWGGMGDRTISLSQVPEIERNEKVYEMVDGEKYTYGEVNGVGLPANKQKRLAGQIKEYLQENTLPSYFKNKAAAYHSIHRADAKAKAEAARVQRENKILAGKTSAGEDKRKLFDTAMQPSYNDLKKYRDDNWKDWQPDYLAVIDLALEKQKRRARR